jgi:hypothetical protein
VIRVGCVPEARDFGLKVVGHEASCCAACASFSGLLFRLGRLLASLHLVVRLGLRAQHPPQHVILSLFIGFCHLSPIGRMSVPDLAELALGTLEHIIDEAEQYVQEEPRKSSRDKRTQGQG